MAKKSKKSKKGSAKKSKKAVHKKEAIEMESQTQEAVNNTSISTERPSETQPKSNTEVKKKTTSVKGKEESGFTSGSKSSLIYSLLSDGKHTREEIISILNEKYPAANNKSSLSTFISDVQKPIGTYSTSRGVKVVTSEDGILSIEK